MKLKTSSSEDPASGLWFYQTCLRMLQCWKTWERKIVTMIAEAGLLFLEVNHLPVEEVVLEDSLLEPLETVEVVVDSPDLEEAEKVLVMEEVMVVVVVKEYNLKLLISIFFLSFFFWCFLTSNQKQPKKYIVYLCIKEYIRIRKKILKIVWGHNDNFFTDLHVSIFTNWR